MATRYEDNCSFMQVFVCLRLSSIVSASPMRGRRPTLPRSCRQCRIVAWQKTGEMGRLDLVFWKERPFAYRYVQHDRQHGFFGSSGQDISARVPRGSPTSLAICRSIQNMPVPFSYFHLLNILISLTVFATGIRPSGSGLGNAVLYCKVQLRALVLCFAKHAGILEWGFVPCKHGCN